MKNKLYRIGHLLIMILVEDLLMAVYIIMKQAFCISPKLYMTSSMKKNVGRTCNDESAGAVHSGLLL